MRLLLTELRLRLDDAERNFDAVKHAVERNELEPGPLDVLLLPELIVGAVPAARYESCVGELARALGCHVVGGSHYREDASGRTNCGVAVGPDGRPRTRYEKRRPYGGGQDALPGAALEPLEIEGRIFRTLVCADFWYGEFWQEGFRPDVVLVPALSVSRKPSPRFARSMWRHMAIARAYEYGVFVGVSDWAHGSPGPDHCASGVAGLADPTGTDPAGFFAPVGDAGVRAYPLDLAALDCLRADRRQRGFLQTDRLTA